MNRVARRVERDQENGARKAIIEELFNDFYRSRHSVYWMNFTRGLFFGVGSILGGTLVVAIVLALLGYLTDIPGGFGDFIQFIVDTVRRS